MKKILIVDEDVKIMSYLDADLKSTHNFDVIWLTSAEKVIETLSSSVFDAIILDIMMPIPPDWSSDEQRRAESGLSTGIVLFEKIRVQFPSIPIIVYSAKRVSIEDKYTSILRKPVLNSEIVEHLNKLINNEK